ncbi:hypothetical protein GPJ56_004374 [Histomonas meleagridis]|uniref:uncharacterized protein n=1 Tax=Histomonas meleagridis TaxID=135588 RepID=UPI003559C2C4|nr:hypothetical protein GPJ56_004374 [Histomonas meleagridis]KAH0799981.1 hypothetical protein GO595_007093 [Histomonas meleagridis]
MIGELYLLKNPKKQIPIQAILPPGRKFQRKTKKHKEQHFPKVDFESYVNRISEIRIEKENEEKQIREEYEEQQAKKELKKIEELKEEPSLITEKDQFTKEEELPKKAIEPNEEEDESFEEEEDITELLNQPLPKDFDPCRCLNQLTESISDTRVRSHFLQLYSQEILIQIEDKRNEFRRFLKVMSEKCSNEKEKSICFYAYAFSHLLEPLSLDDIRNQMLPIFFLLLPKLAKNDINMNDCSHFLYFMLESLVFKPEHIKVLVPLIVDNMIELLNNSLFDLAECVEYTLKSLSFRKLNDRSKIDRIIPEIEKRCEETGASYKGMFYRIKHPVKQTQMENFLNTLKINLNE